MSFIGFSIKDSVAYTPVTNKVVKPLDFKTDVKALFTVMEKITKLNYKYQINCLPITEKNKLPRTGYVVTILYCGEPWDVVATSTKVSNTDLKSALYSAIIAFNEHYKKIQNELQIHDLEIEN